MRIVYAGTPDVAVPALEAILTSARHEVAAVITRPDARKGRGRTLHRSPVGAVADAAGVPVLAPPSARDPEFLAQLEQLQPDAAAVVAYGSLLPQAVLDVPRHGWVNLHFSLLPAWRGAAPVNAAIAAGDEITGASTFRLEAGMDTGPVYGTITDTVGPRDTAGELLERLAVSGARLLLDTLDGIASGDLSPVPQSADGVSYAPKLSTEHARIRWDLPPHLVDRHIRSLTPVPGAWTTLAGNRFKVGSVRLTTPEEVPAEAAELAPGALAWTKKAVFVGTSGAPLVLEQVQPPGKKLMAATDWVRGGRLTEPVVFE